MTDTSDILLLVGLPIAIALLIAVVLVSPWISPRARTVVERILAVVIYPAGAIALGWLGLEYWRDGDWLRCVLNAVFAAGLLALAFRAIRQGRLAPIGARR